MPSKISRRQFNHIVGAAALGLTALSARAAAAAGPVAAPSPSPAKPNHIGRPRFGVNYVPSRNWWHSWVDWDAASIREDLLAIAALGMDHLRIHCIWPVFQPDPAWVSPAALDRLNELLDLADAAELDVEVAVLDGWLSGYALMPAWTDGKNIFTDPDQIECQKRLYSAIAARVGAHRRFLGFDLANEINVIQDIKIPVTVAEGDAWQAAIMAHCQSVAPGKFHVNGIGHSSWFIDRNFSRETLSSVGSAAAVHVWTKFTGAGDLFKPMSTGWVHLAEYNIELAKAYSRPLDRLVWLQEYGMTAQWLPAAQIPDFAEQFTRNALSCAHLWGCTWWCSHDLPAKFSGFNRIEYDMGLLDSNNRAKPAGKRLAGLIREWKQTPPAPLSRPVALVLPDQLMAQKTAPKRQANLPGWRLGKRFMELIEGGTRPAIVLESRAEDQEYLKARGIRDLVRL